MTPIIYQICPFCKGSGWVTVHQYSQGTAAGKSVTSYNETCKACGGTGKTDEAIGYFDLEKKP